MTDSYQLLLLSAGVAAVSFCSGLIPLWLRMGHRTTQIVLSAVAGVMLGIGLLHLLPHALDEAMAAGGEGADPGEVLASLVLALLGGFLVMFLLERFVCYHHHDGAEAEDECEHGHRPAHAHGAHALRSSGALVGLSIHSVLEGVALAAAVSAGGDAPLALSLGTATWLAIVLHKPFDAMTLGALLAQAGRSGRYRFFVNAVFALMAPLGALLFAVGVEGEAYPQLVALALAFSAGTFLCIACSDLLPELQFHDHDRVALSAALITGVVIAWGISRIEAHAHGHGDHATEEVHQHSDATAPHQPDPTGVLR
ncbi:MAG: hypothetical protein EXS00_01025 [Phycisphaerales bacterium]|nr:hypothetical protein [Phycisphaerales bacterium]